MKGLLLLSGGIDSPVAGKLVLDKGFDLIAVHFANYPVTNNSAEKKAIELAQRLGLKKLYVINLGKVFTALASNCLHKYYFVLMKRAMLRVAQIIAWKEACDFLITGDSLGQVSSQTLSCMTVIDSASQLQIHRPLISFDKQEIIDLSSTYGFFEISKGPEICDALGPSHPATKASKEIILEEEKKLDFDSLISEALNNEKVLEF